MSIWYCCVKNSCKKNTRVINISASENEKIKIHEEESYGIGKRIIKNNKKLIPMQERYSKRIETKDNSEEPNDSIDSFKRNEKSVTPMLLRQQDDRVNQQINHHNENNSKSKKIEDKKNSSSEKIFKFKEENNETSFKSERADICSQTTADKTQNERKFIFVIKMKDGNVDEIRKINNDIDLKVPKNNLQNVNRNYLIQEVSNQPKYLLENNKKPNDELVGKDEIGYYKVNDQCIGLKKFYKKTSSTWSVESMNNSITNNETVDLKK